MIYKYRGLIFTKLSYVYICRSVMKIKKVYKTMYTRNMTYKSVQRIRKVNVTSE